MANVYLIRSSCVPFSNTDNPIIHSSSCMTPSFRWSKKQNIRSVKISSVVMPNSFCNNSLNINRSKPCKNTVFRNYVLVFKKPYSNGLKGEVGWGSRPTSYDTIWTYSHCIVLINLFYQPKRQYNQSLANGHHLEVLLKNLGNLCNQTFKEKLQY